MRDRTFQGHAPVYAGDDGQLLVDTDAVSGDFGYEDDDGYDDDIEVGAPAFIERSRERRAKRKGRRATRKRGRADKLDAKAGTLRSKNQPQRHQDEDWVGTVLSGSQDLTAAGAWTVTMRPQHDFRANDISFPGSTSGCDVTAVYFGDRPVWQALGAC